MALTDLNQVPDEPQVILHGFIGIQSIPPDQAVREVVRTVAPILVFQEFLAHKQHRDTGCSQQKCVGQTATATRIPRPCIGGIRKPGNAGLRGAAAGCASAVVTYRCTPARRRREPQVLPAYGPQDLRHKNKNPRPEPNQIQQPAPRSPLEEAMEADISILRKTGHFYFALTPTGTSHRAPPHREGPRRRIQVCRASMSFSPASPTCRAFWALLNNRSGSQRRIT